MSLPHLYNVSGGPAPPRRRQNPNQPPNLLTTSLGNARNAGLGLGRVVQTPISSTTLSSPFSAYPQSTNPQSPGGAMRGASPMASRSASAFSAHYNPQQWGAVNNFSSTSLSMAGEHRQTSHLAPHPVGPDEPVASPPPPYSPRRDQQSQDSPRRTSDIVSPADTTSPDTEYSRYGTPVSAATTMSPDLVSRRSPLIRQHTSPKESPNAALAPSFPPPPGQRIRAGSKNPADRLLSSLTLKGKASKVSLAGDAIETLQNRTAQMQASSATYNDPMVHAPAARRAASTGGIGLAGASSRSSSQTPSPVTWEPDMPLPPPPPGPPRSQSLNRPTETPSFGIAPTLPLRFRGPPGTGTSLETVPPTPADWREEDGTNGGAPSRHRLPSSLHIDTSSILRKRRSGTVYPMTATAGGSAHPRRDSSAGGLFRSPAFRNRSAMGIRERRSESRIGKDRAVEDSAVEPSSSVAPWAADFSVVVSPSLPVKTFSVPPPKRLSVPSKALSLIVPPGPEQRPVSHLLHMPNSDDSMQVPLTPSTKAAQEPPEDLLGPESPKLFARRAIERHRLFAEREAAAANDSERLDLFVQYMKAESRIRREQYASVFEEDCIEVDELTQGLFGHFHDRQQSLSGQDTSKRTSIASSTFEDSTSSSAVSRKHESPSSASSTQQQPESYWKEDYVPCLSPIASMSIVTGQDEMDSRGRAPSRWFEDQSHSGDGLLGDAFKVLQRSKRESKYMGNPPALYGNTASPLTGGGQWQPSGANRQLSYGPNQYPPEKTGWHQEEPPPFLPPTPSSAPFTPDSRRLDILRLVTLPPPVRAHFRSVCFCSRLLFKSLDILY